METSRCRIGIIGAGTSGVYLATLLAEQGYQVTLFEKAPQPRTDGCGILLISSGLEAIQAHHPQLCQKLIAAGSPATRFEFRNLRGDLTNVQTVDYQVDELPGMLIHRKAILETLLSELPENILHLTKQLTHIEQTPETVTAYFQDGSYWQGDLLVGCDGIFSNVRQSVVPDVGVNYLGDIVWRSIVPDSTFCPEGSFYVYIRGRGVYANFFDIGGGFTHWGFFIEQDQTPEEKGSPRPQDTKIPPEELSKIPDDARAIIESTPVEQIVTNFSYDIDPLPRLYQNRVVLMGDAAHAKSPSRARGMTSGFEDVLCLTQHLNDHSSIPDVLAAFQSERLPIVHEYQRSSREVSQKTGRIKRRSA